MTTEDRLTRIENALIAKGLMEPDPLPDYQSVREGLAKGDTEPLKRFVAAAQRQGRLLEALEAAGILGRKKHDTHRP